MYNSFHLIELKLFEWIILQDYIIHFRYIKKNLLSQILAGSEVLPQDTLFPTKKYKGFSKFITGNSLRPDFSVYILK